MLDFNAPEFVVVAIVALIVIGPKDLPKAMRFVGKWFGKARAVARQFRSGFDSMVREAELAELEKQWAAENARIMSEHPPAALPAPEAEVHAVGEDAAPVMVEQPAILGETPGVSAQAPTPKRARKPAAVAAEPVAEPAARPAPKPRARKAAAASAEPAAKPRTRKKAAPPAEAAE
ncbi:Sec-independent protein translocase protein TatB [Sphingomonas sp. CBMAI 2297]|uniref:Sec-independent protein translocase protein TatB n=1 Tax=Sphingomonas sp. CBMAI 2297 TaxID=2991720 RepID=UPI002453E88D|nr:Sec-independent protein translocase protein TatB [Sphingomonas sp. CBMAI 2297]MDH4744427.1 Sec-independent protein translocase protein TatB [Sphingomonas sp. CBMAI 2297]